MGKGCARKAGAIRWTRRIVLDDIVNGCLVFFLVSERCQRMEFWAFARSVCFDEGISSAMFVLGNKELIFISKEKLEIFVS